MHIGTGQCSSKKHSTKTTSIGLVSLRYLVLYSGVSRPVPDHSIRDHSPQLNLFNVLLLGGRQRSSILSIDLYRDTADGLIFLLEFRQEFDKESAFQNCLLSLRLLFLLLAVAVLNYSRNKGYYERE
jgi:hypothetical protein